MPSTPSDPREPYEPILAIVRECQIPLSNRLEQCASGRVEYWREFGRNTVPVGAERRVILALIQQDCPGIALAVVNQAINELVGTRQTLLEQRKGGDFDDIYRLPTAEPLNAANSRVAPGGPPEAAQRDDQATLRILHLSDLHFIADTPVARRLEWLVQNIRGAEGLDFEQLDFLVISGDLTDRGRAEGLEKACEFVSGLMREFGLSAERGIFVPGNHDVTYLPDAYDRRQDADGLKDEEFVRQGDIVLARNPQQYPRRFEAFSQRFYQKVCQNPYPLDYPSQGMVFPFFEARLQFLTFNSCWQIDEFNGKRSGIHPDAVAYAVHDAQKQEDEARTSGKLGKDALLLRMAVWHHAIAGPEQIKDAQFIGHLQKLGVKIGLHGDVHETRRDHVEPWRKDRSLYVIGAGTFGAPWADRPESTPRLYNLLKIDRDLKSVRVHTRYQQKPDGPWEGWNQWPMPTGEAGGVPYYDIELS